jgi:predicted PurR-regulated permease PerM
MVKEGLKEFSKYFLIGIVILLLFVSYKIIEPYLIVLISAFVLSFIIFPLYSKLKKHLGETFSALICVFIVAVLIILPIGMVVTQITTQTYSLVSGGGLTDFISGFSANPFFDKLDIDLAGIIKTGGRTLLSLTANAARYLPSLLLSFVILIFSIFFMLIKWDDFSKQLREFIPFARKEHLAEEIANSTHAILYGYLLIALIDFVVAAIGLYLLGVNLYLFFACIIAILAFIPGLGAIIVILPLAVYYFLIGEIATLIGIGILGLVLIVGIELFLANWLLSEKSRINPLIMLIGILGGTTIFGVFGFIIGPLVLVYAIRATKELIKD